MKIKPPSKTVITAILIAVLSILWLRELTLRRAIQSANRYMMAFVYNGELYPVDHDFRWFDYLSDLGKTSFSPGWYILYEPIHVLSNGTYVRVSMFGNVTGTSNQNITEALSLPTIEARKEAIDKLLNK